MKLFLNRTILLCCILFVSCSKEMERAYYDNGNLKYEVPLKSGKRNGELVEYYASGELKGKGNYLKGKLHGKSTLYYKNGNIEQINNYEKGEICCKSKFYREDGSLSEIQYFDKDGRFVNFKKFKKNGEKDNRITSKKAIFIAESDTIYKKEGYHAKICLGNRTYNYIDVFIGNPKDRMILHSDRLPKKNKITAILELTPEELEHGSNDITGVIYEINLNDREEANVIPFKHEIFVKKE